MPLSPYGEPLRGKRQLLLVEWSTLAYTLLTLLLLLFHWQQIHTPWLLLEGRAFVLVGMALLWLIYVARPNRYSLLLRYLFPLTLLGYWYPDTYEFCQLLPNLDHLFAQADLTLFGTQPSIAFSQWLPQKLWSELFHMGYFAYYPLILITLLAPLVQRKNELFGRTAFVVLASFFLYYTIYLFLPVAGPQYYFQAVGFDVIESAHFPQLFDYFRSHTELAPSPGPEGFFRSLVESTQQSGERPTAAFPSSHVGMSTVLLLLLRHNRQRWLLLGMLPFYFFLCCATVYIQAHYLIDVMGGLVTALCFYALTSWVWQKCVRGAKC